MIEVRPDPAHPHGGFALLEAAGSTLPEETARVEVFDSFAGRYLGPSGWQATRFAFGPYPVERGPEGDRLRIGPEIVNRLTEYQSVRLQVGPLRADLSWPDDVVPAPDAAISGGIWTAPAAPKPAPQPAVVLKAPMETPAPNAAAGSGTTTGTSQTAGVQTGTDAAAPSRKPLLFAGLAALILIAAAAAYVLIRAPEQEAPPPPPPPPAEDACAMPALTALAGQGFAAVAEQLRQCGGRVTPDDALSLLETAARGNDPVALTLFGRIYDAEATDAGLETGLGLTFSDNPARAAEYYNRAAQAGSVEAGPLLQTVCRRLLLMTDTLSQSAHEDHCGS